MYDYVFEDKPNFLQYSNLQLYKTKEYLKKIIKNILRLND